MVRFGEKEIAKEKFRAGEKTFKNWGVNVDNIAISKLIGTKTNKPDKAIRALVFMP